MIHYELKNLETGAKVTQSPSLTAVRNDMFILSAVYNILKFAVYCVNYKGKRLMMEAWEWDETVEDFKPIHVS